VIVAIILGVVALVANVYATRLVITDDTFEPAQKYCQAAIIWLLPLLGAVIVAGFIRSDKVDSKPSRRTGNDTGFDDENDAIDLSRSQSFDSMEGD
jgi:hypothetical protein